jgi:large subunit ribosomal protein L34
MSTQVSQPKKAKRLRKHGFLVRMSTKKGTDVIKRRRNKGRAKLSI